MTNMTSYPDVVIEACQYIGAKAAHDGLFPKWQVYKWIDKSKFRIEHLTSQKPVLWRVAAIDEKTKKTISVTVEAPWVGEEPDEDKNNEDESDGRD